MLKDYIIYGVIAVVMTGCGSAWLERLVWDQEVAGSNPVTPIFIIQYDMREWLSGGVSPCQGEGRGFESRLALFYWLEFP